MGLFHSKNYSHGLRVGMTQKQKAAGPVRILRYDREGKLIEGLEQTVEQINASRRTMEKLAKMTPEQKAQLLKELEDN